MEDFVDRGLGVTFQVGVHCEALLDQNSGVPKPRGPARVHEDQIPSIFLPHSLNPIAGFLTRGTSIGLLSCDRRLILNRDTTRRLGGSRWSQRERAQHSAYCE
jgi:hypothetical protein